VQEHRDRASLAIGLVLSSSELRASSSVLELKTNEGESRALALVIESIGSAAQWAPLLHLDTPLSQNRKMEKVVTRSVQQVAVNSAIA
jgi:hypothetical protein